MNTHLARRRPLAIALATFVVGGSLSLLGSALLQPAQAREFTSLVVTKDAPVFAQFPGIPNNLAYPRAPDPDLCRTADYCDTIPVKIPIPDIPASSDFKLVFKADNTDGADIDVFFWDNKQLKARYGKCKPGETCYDPLESDYTTLIVDPEPNASGPTENGVFTLGRPELVDYNITVLNYGGVSTGYTIYMKLEVVASTAPDEVKPPDTNKVATSGKPTTVTATPTPTASATTDAVIGTPSGGPTLNDLLIERDPDLQAVQGQNLADQLKAPASQIAALGRAETGPPPPVSGLTLLLWLAVMPAVLAGGAGTLVQRRRVQIPDLA